eukprot:13996661-Alexandrium_andersonii.AAC.1
MHQLRGGMTQSVDGSSEYQPSETEVEEDRKAWANLRRDGRTGGASHSWEGAGGGCSLGSAAGPPPSGGGEASERAKDWHTAS